MNVAARTTQTIDSWLSEGWISVTLPGSVLYQSQPGEAFDDQTVLEKLGYRGWHRLKQFRTLYTQGWGEGDGKPLSPRALGAFHRFLKVSTFPASSTPSIFLSKEGGLGLAWEDESDRAIEVTILADRVDYFRESLGEEDSVPTDRTEEIARLLSQR
jgi:hypothetical protein